MCCGQAAVKSSTLKGISKAGAAMGGMVQDAPPQPVISTVFEGSFFGWRSVTFIPQLSHFSMRPTVSCFDWRRFMGSVYAAMQSLID
jgi:hypothetical protein